MRRLLLRCVPFVALCGLIGAADVRGDEPAAEAMAFFETKVRPLLVEKCQKCHGAKMQKGGLRLDSREGLLKGGDSGPVVEPGKPDVSELVRAVRYEADGFQMPPTGKLDDASIAILTEWVRRGAPWPAAASAKGSSTESGFDFAERAKHWAFQPLKRTVPPAGSAAANPVDAYLADARRRAGLQAAPPADRRAWLRRITFDLIGLPPTLNELGDYLNDHSPMADERVIERLLASPHYGERWGRHWLDLVRYAETFGHEFDFEISHPWPYRDYVVRALNADLPYDRFVAEHIAGDLLPPRLAAGGANEAVVGTAFWWFGQAKHSPVDIRAEECDTIDNQLDVFGKTFLGLTIACARCHDHKFDAIRTTDYYALAGFLQSSRQQVAFLQPATDARHIAERDSSARRLIESLAKTDVNASTPAPAEFLVPAKELLAAKDSVALATVKSRLAAKAKADADAAAADRIDRVSFEEFEDAGLAGWTRLGAAFGDRPSRSGDFVIAGEPSKPSLTFAPHGAAHSGLIAPALRGTLQSRTFTIQKPFIHYRAARVAPAINLPQAFKAGQLNLVVDGFQIIKEPLYGFLSISVHNDGEPRWYTQNVSKLVGRKAYIELVDEDQGWLAVDAIRFSERSASPIAPPNRLFVDFLSNPAVKTAAGVENLLQRIAFETLLKWDSGELASDRDAADRVPFLRWATERTFAGPSPPIAAALRSLVEAGRRTVPSDRALAMADGTSENEFVLARGNHKKPAAETPRRFLEVFGSAAIPASETGSGRLQLAAEVTGRGRAVARVLVNRLWHHHFGVGLVPSLDDFGKMGQPPSHPELLDYLAAEFIHSGWSIKHVQRLLLTTDAYRMASRAANSSAESIDPANRLLHRMPVKRLEAEPIRDAMLALSGRADWRMEGPSVPVHLTEFMTGRGRPAHSGLLDGGGRRSVYLAIRRNFLPPMFLAFDYPTPFTTAGRRGTSNVPAQALTMLNNPFVVEQAQRWGRKLATSPGSADDRIRTLYEMALSRPPSDAELREARTIVARPDATAEDWGDLCHVLMSLKEFIYLP